MKPNIFKRSVWTLLTVFFTLLLSVVLVGRMLVADSVDWIDSYFHAERTKLVQDEDGTDPAESIYYADDFAKRDAAGNLILEKSENGVYNQVLDHEAMRAYSMDVAKRVDEEGTVLLWNNNGALPLAAGERNVTLFGINFTDWRTSAQGSGGVSIDPPDVYGVLKEHGFETNPNMQTLMKLARPGYGPSFQQKYEGSVEYDEYGIQYIWKVGECPWEVLNSTAKGSVRSNIGKYGDAALFLITRNGSEGGDVFPYDDESEDGSFLSLTKAEVSVLKGLEELKKDGVIKKSILLINSPTQVSLRYAQGIDIDACLWIGLGGNPAVDAVADILTGDAYPSGRLPDTWAMDNYGAPSMACVREQGTFLRTFKNAENFNFEPFQNDGSFFNKYIVYREGIYVGYRYYETRYEDAVLGQGNASSAAGSTVDGGWSYEQEVAYPFGYGLGYTTFEHSNYKVDKEGSEYRVTMTIKNTGSRPGKDVMQVYVQKPYTEYDRANKVEKASVELVGFQKTRELAAGESQTLTLTVSEYEFKTYDAYGKGTYILEKGDYYLAAGTDAHDAVNNILAAKGKTALGDAAFAHKVNYAKDEDTYATSPYTGTAITNRLDDVDFNRYPGNGGQSVTYLSRSDWEATYPTEPLDLAATAQIAADTALEVSVPESSGELPLYDTVTSEYGKLSLVQLYGTEYDDPLWEDLLNQLSWEDSVLLMSRSTYRLYAAPTVSSPGITAMDGPCGCARGDVIEGLTTRMAFPSAPTVAATFNRDLLEELGKAMAGEFKHAGNVGVYGVGIDIHRSAFGGRNWEYYSEDGFLSGELNTTISKSLTDRGMVLFTKHFVLNDQECARAGIQIWCNEQATREIYLKAFEKGAATGITNGIMTSYNRTGAKWVGLCDGLINKIVRGEWGYNGILETDSASGRHMGIGSNTIYAASVCMGQGNWMGNMGSDSLDAWKNNATVANALREAAHRTLYTTLYSAGMNGITANTRVVNVIPAWEMTIIVIEVLSGVFAAGCLTMTILSWVFAKKKEQKA